MSNNSSISFNNPLAQLNNSDSIQCIQSNPDISGIGVRYAIYLQALLSIIYPLVFTMKDGELNVTESRTMTRISVNIILTACALLLSTVIQAWTIGIDLYHVLIILQLSWINSMTFMVVYFVKRAEQSIAAQRSTPAWRGLAWVSKMNYCALLFSPEALVSNLHFTIVGAIGIWVWKGVENFGNQANCNQETFIVVFSKSIGVTHHSARILSLIVYSIALIPFFNIWILGNVIGNIASLSRGVLVCVLGPCICCLGMCCRCFSNRKAEYVDDQGQIDPDALVDSAAFARLTFLFAISGFAVAMIILIVDAELMIHRSFALVQPGENQWTFGQTLTVIMLFFPLKELVGIIRKTVHEDY